MKLYYDLHIHTACSACGEEEMTPNNVINMALIKELDVIAITDHNTCQNIKPYMEVAKETDLLVIPGIEVQTKEDVHILCLFPSLEKALAFEDKLSVYRMELPHKGDKFGHQYLCNENDEFIGEVPFSLMLSIDIDLKSLISLAHDLQGICIPAHVDKASYSIIAALGFLPKDLAFDAIEVVSAVPQKTKWPVLRNSDAHMLYQIKERHRYVDAKEASIEAVLEAIRKGAIY